MAGNSKVAVTIHQYFKSVKVGESKPTAAKWHERQTFLLKLKTC